MASSKRDEIADEREIYEATRRERERDISETLKRRYPRKDSCFFFHTLAFPSCQNSRKKREDPRPSFFRESDFYTHSFLERPYFYKHLILRVYWRSVHPMLTSLKIYESRCMNGKVGLACEHPRHNHFPRTDDIHEIQ